MVAQPRSGPGLGYLTSHLVHTFKSPSELGRLEVRTSVVKSLGDLEEFF
jgi:hypothetical protein